MDVLGWIWVFHHETQSHSMKRVSKTQNKCHYIYLTFVGSFFFFPLAHTKQRQTLCSASGSYCADRSNSRKIISQCFHLCLSLFPISFLPCNYPFLHLYISIWWQLDYAETGRKMRGWKDIDINNCDLVGNALLCYFHILFILVTSFRKMNTCWLIEQRKKISRNKTSVMHDNQG